MTGFFKSLAAGLVATGIWGEGLWLVAAILVAVIGGWWVRVWGRKWFQRRKKEKQEREEREFRAKVECCVREVLREMKADDREVETLPSLSDGENWLVRGYRDGNIVEQLGYADREEAEQAGRRLLEWRDYPDPDGCPVSHQIKVWNLKTGEVVLSLGPMPGL